MEMIEVAQTKAETEKDALVFERAFSLIGYSAALPIP
jgi:hypothetical protein